MSGRTTWWPKDAAWLRRELVVELGDEFGPSGPLVLDALCGWAQEQRSSGLVRGGWRALAREAFVTVCCAQTVVERAAQIGPDVGDRTSPTVSPKRSSTLPSTSPSET